MKRSSFFSIVIFFQLAVFSSGTAVYAIDTIKLRIVDMQAKIDQGVNAGEITPREEQRLRNELNSILAEGIRMKADGRLNRLEKMRLHSRLDELGKHIYREQHDRDNILSNIHQRVAEMHQRIDQGVRSGEITRQEERRLRKELNKIRDDEARMKRDGRLTKQEIDRLNAELDRLSKHIYLEKHDRDSRRR
jgi:hypothetical protein